MDLCVIIPVITGVVSALLGYTLGKMFNADRGSADVELWKNRYVALEKELAEVRSQLTDLREAENPRGGYDSWKVRAVFGKEIAENDLKIIEGIGVKVEELFHKHGIFTWQDLAETSVEKCRELLDTEGARFRGQDPETWSEQARMAAEGKWEELYAWQQKLSGGRS